MLSAEVHKLVAPCLREGGVLIKRRAVMAADRTVGLLRLSLRGLVCVVSVEIKRGLREGN